MSWFNKLHETFIDGDRYKMLLEGFGNTILITIGALVLLNLAIYFRNSTLDKKKA